MRRSLRWMLLPLFVWLSGCHHAHHARIGFHYGFVSVERDAVVIRVKGYDQARVTPQGQLLVGGKALAVSPEGQAALARYNAAGHQFVDRSLKLGLDSANFALHTVGEAFKGLLHGDPDRVGQSAEQGSHDIEARARTLCQALQDWRRAQDDIVVAVPEFRPYAVIDPEEVGDCTVEVHPGLAQKS